MPFNGKTPKDKKKAKEEGKEDNPEDDDSVSDNETARILQLNNWSLITFDSIVLKKFLLIVEYMSVLIMKVWRSRLLWRSTLFSQY